MSDIDGVITVTGEREDFSNPLDYVDSMGGYGMPDDPFEDQEGDFYSQAVDHSDTQISISQAEFDAMISERTALDQDYSRGRISDVEYKQRTADILDRYGVPYDPYSLDAFGASDQFGLLSNRVNVYDPEQDNQVNTGGFPSGGSTQGGGGSGGADGGVPSTPSDGGSGTTGGNPTVEIVGDYDIVDGPINTGNNDTGQPVYVDEHPWTYQGGTVFQNSQTGEIVNVGGAQETGYVIGEQYGRAGDGTLVDINNQPITQTAYDPQSGNFYVIGIPGVEYDPLTGLPTGTPVAGDGNLDGVPGDYNGDGVTDPTFNPNGSGGLTGDAVVQTPTGIPGTVLTPPPGGGGGDGGGTDGEGDGDGSGDGDSSGTGNGLFGRGRLTAGGVTAQLFSPSDFKLDNIPQSMFSFSRRFREFW